MEILEEPTLQAPDPILGMPVLSDEAAKPVVLRVARDEKDLEGHILVSFSRKGRVTCQELLACPSTSALLERAERDGVDVTEPVLIANVNDTGTSRTVYLTPKPENNFRDFAVWVGQVLDTLANLKARSVGFYLCRDGMMIEDLADVIGQVIRALVEKNAADSICLFVGQYGYNEVLTTALALKQELEGGPTPVHVLH